MDNRKILLSYTNEELDEVIELEQLYVKYENEYDYVLKLWRGGKLKGQLPYSFKENAIRRFYVEVDQRKYIINNKGE